MIMMWSNYDDYAHILSYFLLAYMLIKDANAIISVFEWIMLNSFHL